MKFYQEKIDCKKKTATYLFIIREFFSTKKNSHEASFDCLLAVKLNLESVERLLTQFFFSQKQYEEKIKIKNSSSEIPIYLQFKISEKKKLNEKQCR